MVHFFHKNGRMRYGLGSPWERHDDSGGPPRRRTPNWLHRYNWHRPHGSLKSETPISRLGLTEDNLLRLHI